MRRIRKKYKGPKKPLDKARIEREKELMHTYGLKKKREIWKAEAVVRRYRRLARKLAAQPDEKVKKEIMGKLKKLGILKKVKTLDDILGLKVEDVLERRLQTILFRKKLANSPRHARQLIVHGHVKIGGRKVTFPSYLVPRREERKIEVS